MTELISNLFSIFFSLKTFVEGCSCVLFYEFTTFTFGHMELIIADLNMSCVSAVTGFLTGSDRIPVLGMSHIKVCTLISTMMDRADLQFLVERNKFQP